MLIIFLGFIAIIAFFILVLVMIYNGLVRSRNEVKNAFSQIDVQLKRRHDLIPNLVETAKGYMKHERDTLESVTRMRQQAINVSGDIKARAEIENMLSDTLKHFMAVSENYPDLKANTNFLSLQEELTSTENKIGFSRQYYNDAVMNYNNKIQTIPSNFIAGPFGFREEVFFQAAESEKSVPQVKF